MTSVYSREMISKKVKRSRDSSISLGNQDLSFTDLEDDAIGVIFELLSLPELIRVGRSCRALHATAKVFVRLINLLVFVC